MQRADDLVRLLDLELDALEDVDGNLLRRNRTAKREATTAARRHALERDLDDLADAGPLHADELVPEDVAVAIVAELGADRRRVELELALPSSASATLDDAEASVVFELETCGSVVVTAEETDETLHLSPSGHASRRPGSRSSRST